MQAVLKEVDEQGRIVLPISWRRKYLKGGKVLVRSRGNALEIVPQDEVDLTAFFDRIEVDIKADLADWHAVLRELWKE
jgi:hypothetical protein